MANEERGILFVSKPAESGDDTGLTFRFTITGFLLRPEPAEPEVPNIIDDKPYCSNLAGTRVNTKYIPDYPYVLPEQEEGGGAA